MNVEHLRHEITLMYQQGGFMSANLNLRTIHALLDCAEALRDLTDFDKPFSGWQLTKARKALAKLEAAP